MLRLDCPSVSADTTNPTAPNSNPWALAGSAYAEFRVVRLGRTQPIIGLAVMEARTCRFEVVERAVSATKVSTGFAVVL